GLAERRGAAEGFPAPVQAGSGPAPEAAVVAVRVSAALGAARVRHADTGGVLRRRVARVAVLALHLIVESREVTLRLGFAGDLETVRVDDRHVDVARLADQRANRGVVPVAVDQLVRPFDDVLGRGPLTSVVQAYGEVDRL